VLAPAADPIQAKVLPRRKEAQASASGIAGGLSWLLPRPDGLSQARRASAHIVLFVGYDLIRTETSHHNQSANGWHRVLVGCRIASSLPAQWTLAGRDGSRRARSDRPAQRRCERLLLGGSRRCA